MILRVQVGSGVHGTSISGQDDRDEMGICLEPARSSPVLPGSRAASTAPGKPLSGPCDASPVRLVAKLATRPPHRWPHSAKPICWYADRRLAYCALRTGTSGST